MNKVYIIYIISTLSFCPGSPSFFHNFCNFYVLTKIILTPLCFRQSRDTTQFLLPYLRLEPFV